MRVEGYLNALKLLAGAGGADDSGRGGVEGFLVGLGWHHDDRLNPPMYGATRTASWRGEGR